MLQDLWDPGGLRSANYMDECTYGGGTTRSTNHLECSYIEQKYGEASWNGPGEETVNIHNEGKWTDVQLAEGSQYGATEEQEGKTLNNPQPSS